MGPCMFAAYACMVSMLVAIPSITGGHAPTQNEQEREITIEGCLRPQASGSEEQPGLAQGRGAKSYVVADAQIVIGSTRLTSRLYLVRGLPDAELTKRVGERVQVRGTIEDGVIHGTMIDQVTGRDKCVAAPKRAGTPG